MEQFEGDYEQFDQGEAPQVEAPQVEEPRKRAPRNPRARYEQPEEKHVTRLPNGRVLKGSRPEQRKNAQFWTEIDENADKLVEQITVEEDISSEESPSRASRSTSANRGPRRPATPRGRKGQKSAPSSSGPKPSQKGFKWPSQQE
ncbi:hypothetical protein [Dictyobacter kobayashii]|uniref:Uncharacterized protein n=1 Tax=Dictyobacter kobayashii TaxID=2014872 RepID=A0A402ADN1_9CHLR|nr:hypothetical protein [Dictyobacter kobayashii]GCE17198.1 hypothetical protein KDK_09980 [Dictyobacter kobayashii]